MLLLTLSKGKNNHRPHWGSPEQVLAVSSTGAQKTSLDPIERPNPSMSNVMKQYTILVVPMTTFLFCFVKFFNRILSSRLPSTPAKN